MTQPPRIHHLHWKTIQESQWKKETKRKEKERNEKKHSRKIFYARCHQKPHNIKFRGEMLREYIDEDFLIKMLFFFNKSNVRSFGDIIQIFQSQDLLSNTKILISITSNQFHFDIQWAVFRLNIFSFSPLQIFGFSSPFNIGRSSLPNTIRTKHKTDKVFSFKEGHKN